MNKENETKKPEKEFKVKNMKKFIASIAIFSMAASFGVKQIFDKPKEPPKNVVTETFVIEKGGNVINAAEEKFEEMAEKKEFDSTKIVTNNLTHESQEAAQKSIDINGGQPTRPGDRFNLTVTEDNRNHLEVSVDPYVEPTKKSQ